ncbi:MAG TPA: rod shape-determining protein MreC [Candidatus Limnocylindria bacterium]|nr:rod shape-determining protein MreC [Candidatus Limnocylindria bacterium]
MFKRAHYLALGALTVLVLALLNLSPNTAGRFKLAIGGLFLPLFGLASSSQSVVDRVSYGLLTKDTLIGEVERLRKENEQLRLANAQARDTLAENTRLRAALGWVPRAPWKLRGTHVIGREPTTFWRVVTIDYGGRDGAQVNQPVLTSEGLVGRIRSVEPTQSKVALIGDPECGVSVIVSETRDNAVIQEARSAAVGDGFVVMRTLQNSPGILAGHSVITSGLGGVFPKGIPVGQVVDTRSMDSGLYTEARVKLAANLNRLEEVWVLTP